MVIGYTTHWIHSLQKIQVNMILLKSIKDLLVPPQPDFVKHCDNLGYVHTSNENSLSFVDSSEYLEEALLNPKIRAVLIHPDLKKKHIRPIDYVECIDPNYAFHKLMENTDEEPPLVPTVINSSARVGRNVAISVNGVTVGENVVIEEGVFIGPRVQIGANAVIQSGARLGCEGIERRISKEGECLYVTHRGSVKIGEGVRVGPNVVIDRGLRPSDLTTVGKFTCIGASSAISHNVKIGERVFIAAGVLISGSTVVSDDVTLGPGAMLSNGITVNKSARVEIGSSALRDIPTSHRVIGIRVFPESGIRPLQLHDDLVSKER